MDTLILAILVSFVAALGFGHMMIPVLRRLAGQQIRDDGPKSHLKKAGTPSMGGLFITLSIVLTMILFYQKVGRYTFAALIGSLAYGTVGLIDDLIKATKHRSLGLRPWQKIFLQLLFAVIISFYAYFDPGIGSEVFIPILNKYVDFGALYIPFCMFFLLALTNSVNLTDGLDGLAGGVTLINAGAYTLIFVATAALKDQLWAKDIVLFSAALTGGVLGFLRYNTYPAKVIMGDTGAFFLGGALSMIAIISKSQLLVPVMGVMFMISTVSCLLQIGSYKLRKKRIFKMAPLHHHFELKGVHETKIVSVYMILTGVACMLAILMLSY